MSRSGQSLPWVSARLSTTMTIDAGSAVLSESRKPRSIDVARVVSKAMNRSWGLVLPVCVWGNQAVNRQSSARLSSVATASRKSAGPLKVVNWHTNERAIDRHSSRDPQIPIGPACRSTTSGVARSTARSKRALVRGCIRPLCDRGVGVYPILAVPAVAV